MNWAELDDAGDIPSGRETHSMTMLADGTVVRFGGLGGLDDDDYGYLNDT